AALGGAIRLGDRVALGAAVHLSDARLAEARVVALGRPDEGLEATPADELLLSMAARDRLVVGGAVGVLFAPLTIPIEVAVGLRHRHRIGARGDAALTASDLGTGPTAVLEDPRAALALPAVTAMASGLRILGRRWSAEVAIDLSWPIGRGRGDGDGRPRWRLDGVAVTDVDGVTTPLEGLAGFVVARPHW